MALIKCTECGREISDAAAACPGCGHPLKPNAESSRAPAVTPQPATPKSASSGGLPKGPVFFVMVVLGLLASWVYSGRDSSTSSELHEPAGIDDVEAAYRVCAAFDATGLISEECVVSGRDGSVTVSMDTNSAEARKICAGAVSQMTRHHDFERPWKLKIVSPYSDGRPIATCTLR